jgi:hypothetical protein
VGGFKLITALVVLLGVLLGFFGFIYFTKNATAPCPSGQRVALKKPYALNSGYAYTANLLEFQQISDSMGLPTRSRVVLCEDGWVLGPAHSQHDEIRKLGRVLIKASD